MSWWASWGAVFVGTVLAAFGAAWATYKWTRNDTEKDRRTQDWKDSISAAQKKADDAHEKLSDAQARLAEVSHQCETRLDAFRLEVRNLLEEAKDARVKHVEEDHDQFASLDKKVSRIADHLKLQLGD